MPREIDGETLFLLMIDLEIDRGAGGALHLLFELVDELLVFHASCQCTAYETPSARMAATPEALCLAPNVTPAESFP
jgi:hypothetical protein